LPGSLPVFLDRGRFLKADSSRQVAQDIGEHGERMAAEKKPDFSDVTSGSSSTAPASRGDSERTITVQAGDSLSKIAKRELGDADKWQAIYDANRDKIKDPDLIHPGQVLNLPSNDRA
jgi:nucleoid-associated protein YgaU